jgi:iron complex transport system substrate-binding protein
MVRKTYLCFLLIVLWAATACAAPPQRIVSVSPNLTEILYGLGVFDRVVGVTDYCTYPPEAKSRERVGGWSTPNLERIVRLHPDLVVLTQAQAPILAYNLKQLGIHFLVTPSQSVPDVFSAINEVGAAIGKQREAQALAVSTRATLDRVRKRTSGRARPTVIVAVDRSPGSLRDLYVATQGSYLADLVEIAGGHVVAPPTASGYSQISKEKLIILNADFVLELKPGAIAGDAQRARSDWQELPALKAVRNSRVYELTDDFIPHNSQLIARTVVLLAHILHPEIPLRELEAQ